MPSLVLVNAIALAAASVWLARLVLPSARAIRVRNAFLLRRGVPADFAWTPASVPVDFRQERAPPPPAIAHAVDAAGLARADDDWTKARELAGVLVRHAREETPIRADLDTTFAGILAGRGYCSDYVRVYLAAARAAGLFCRQWAFSFDGFGGHGHTVVEVWDRARQRWAMLDVHNNVFATRTGDPMDVAELREALVAAPASVAFRRLAEGRLGYAHADKLLDYYRRGVHEWYLWYGNDVVTRERRGVARLFSVISGGLAHRVASALGRLPSIVVAVTPANRHAVERMESLRRQVRLAAAIVFALIALLVLQRVASHA